MTGNHRFDAQRMFRHACAYHDCSEFCKSAPNSIIVRSSWYTTPEITNAAFACEIYMKTLSFDATAALSRGHDLSILWHNLSTEDRRGIKEELTSIDNTISDDQFDSMLSNISNAFDVWRYIYEKNGASIQLGYLRSLCCALREHTCKKLYACTWSEYSSRFE